MGFGGLALANLLGNTGIETEETGGASRTHFPGRAKHIIHVFLNGGVSQVDTFDPKPELTRRAGRCCRLRICRLSGRRSGVAEPVQVREARSKRD